MVVPILELGGAAEKGKRRNCGGQAGARGESARLLAPFWFGLVWFGFGPFDRIRAGRARAGGAATDSSAAVSSTTLCLCGVDAVQIGRASCRERVFLVV